jgi:hypothetical protein
MRKTLVVALVAGALLVPATSADATSASKVCNIHKKAPKFQRVIDLYKGKVNLGTRKHPNGSITGRYAKFKKSETNDGYYAPYGKKLTRYFAKKPVICLLFSGFAGVDMRQIDVKGLRKAVRHPQMNPQWGLRFNKAGKITRAYQVYHP